MSPEQGEPVIESFYHWFDLTGVFIMGVIGGTIARQKGYDIVGFLFIAMVSALGGGMVRDVLINEGTVAAMDTPAYLILAFSGALVARFVYFKGDIWEVVRSHGDALIAALWASVGAFKAITYGLPVLPTILMGVLTATGGGMIRDVLMGNEPSVFGGNQPTVVPAIAGATVTLIGAQTGNLALGAILGPVTSFTIFLVAYHKGWKVPTPNEKALVNDTAAFVTRLAKAAGAKSPSRAERGHRSVNAWRLAQIRRSVERRLAGSPDAHNEVAHDKANDILEDIGTELEPSGPGSETALDNIGFDWRGDSYAEKSGEDYKTMLDQILSDDTLTDLLVDKLEDRNASQSTPRTERRAGLERRRTERPADPESDR
ncbi:trimeric intracellular cation channel family protein [Corynebacterium qintianiae]|uniref:trimeric intracellular cation channel family protein n=1 Tax=Corynebacterium qintianiae TaxID=2709392 RepID=UPI0013EB3ECC|nr:trimeric intracellular cation channel family protein [Corynebacterium qintianiae]